MNAGALVFCLLDADGAYTPEGYELLDTAQVGDYELKLWRGISHVKGEPVKYNEISLNAVGRKFDPQSQNVKLPGSTHALGHRWELLYVVANWIKQFGDLYIGSYVPSKLNVYHRMFRRYLPRLEVSDVYEPFDECQEEKTKYFHVAAKGGMIESLLAEIQSDFDTRRYIDGLPSVVDRATVKAQKIFTEKVGKGEVNNDNYGEMAESAVEQVVDNLRLPSGNELVDIDLFNAVLTNVLSYADRNWPDGAAN